MTLPQAHELLEYWQDQPPAHELLAMLAKSAGWQFGKPPTEEDHRRSLELRWKMGAMNVKQMLEAMGGRQISVDGTVGEAPVGEKLPGIGPFPDGANVTRLH
jgi:hypothetical protein